MEDEEGDDDAADERAATLGVEVAGDIPRDEDERGDVEAVDGVHHDLRGLVADLVEGLAPVARAHEEDEDELGDVQALGGGWGGAGPVAEGHHPRGIGGRVAGASALRGAVRGRAVRTLSDHGETTRTGRRMTESATPGRASGRAGREGPEGPGSRGTQSSDSRGRRCESARGAFAAPSAAAARARVSRRVFRRRVLRVAKAGSWLLLGCIGRIP